MSFTVILLIAAGVLLLYVIGTYNSLVTLRTRIQEALSGIDVQLKRRLDLIPNIVESVKGYAKHEKSVFENVTKPDHLLCRPDHLLRKHKPIT